jgi:hypothetical protein
LQNRTEPERGFAHRPQPFLVSVAGKTTAADGARSSNIAVTIAVNEG